MRKLGRVAVLSACLLAVTRFSASLWYRYIFVGPISFHDKIDLLIIPFLTLSPWNNLNGFAICNSLSFHSATLPHLSSITSRIHLISKYYPMCKNFKFFALLEQYHTSFHCPIPNHSLPCHTTRKRSTECQVPTWHNPKTSGWEFITKARGAIQNMNGLKFEVPRVGRS